MTASGNPYVSSWTQQIASGAKAYPGPQVETPVDNIPNTVWVPESSP
jgi:hypothetical protein